MSERLEEIKKWYEYNSNNDWEMMAFNKKHIKHLIEQAEIAHYFAKKNGELNEFLNEYSEVEHWGKNVIDVAMDIIRNQVERVEELESGLNTANDLKTTWFNHYQAEARKRIEYFKAIESIKDIAEFEHLTKGESMDKINELLADIFND